MSLLFKDHCIDVYDLMLFFNDLSRGVLLIKLIEYSRNSHMVNFRYNIATAPMVGARRIFYQPDDTDDFQIPMMTWTCDHVTADQSCPMHIQNE